MAKIYKRPKRKLNKPRFTLKVTLQ
uniref:Uncharacterized protein n=1 Tax=Tetranychus urticae TaxID=32264 RepID=T1K847_TETUR